MSATTTGNPAEAATPSVVVVLLPLIAVVLVLFLITGLAIPAPSCLSAAERMWPADFDRQHREKASSRCVRPID
jgi:hypothetical protein